MKFHYAGKYSGDENTLPQREHPKNAVAFREPEMDRFAVIVNMIGCLIMVILAIPFYLCSRGYFTADSWWYCLGPLAAVAAFVPHEFVHALCFKSDVYMYTNLRQGMLFVVGTESMSKLRFIIMSILPSAIFGFTPYILWCFNHKLLTLGLMGTIGIGSGAGDYMNIVNAVRQMPRGARTYLCGMHSYWYTEK